MGTSAALQPAIQRSVNTRSSILIRPDDAFMNLLLDHDCGKFFLVAFDSPAGVGYEAGVNRYDVFPTPNFEILVRRVVQAALFGLPYSVTLHWSGLKARAEEKIVKVAARIAL